MQFSYKAKKSLNEIIEGKIEAQSLEQAVEQLALEGIIPVVVEPEDPAYAATFKSEALKLRLPGWGLKKIILFTRKLYNLAKSNVTLLRALRLMQEEARDRGEKTLLEDIIGNIKEGMTFSQCLGRYPQYFPLLYVNIIRTGESTGQLKDSFAQLLNYLERLENLRMKVRQALAYPIFMICTGLGTVFVMLTFILPRLVTMFEDFQAALPLPTRVLLGTSAVFRRYWWIALLLAFLFFIALGKRSGGRARLISYFKYRMPLVKRLVEKQGIADFSTSLSLLLRSGLNLLAALGIAGPVIGNPRYITRLEQARQAIKDGASFSQALEKFGIFPEFFLQMIKVGEEGGRLDTILEDIAASYEQEIESDLKIISALIEPAIILVLGVIIGGMVLAVLLPIFNINALVGG